ncbi:hypothetical protein B0A48_18580, partial [Cryoendolithus antarcticus]
MYQYWPRLRINLSLDGFDPLQYQRHCKLNDHLAVREHAQLILGRRSRLRKPIALRMYHQTNFVPQTITYFLQMTSTFSLQSAWEQLPRSGDNLGHVKLSDLSLTTLLLLSVAFQYLIPDPTNDFSTSATSRACFQLALSRLWTLHSQDKEVNLTSKMMVAVQLIIIYGRPFHALGILRQVGM